MVFILVSGLTNDSTIRHINPVREKQLLYSIQAFFVQVYYMSLKMAFDKS